MVLTSASTLMPYPCSSFINSSICRVEWPMVKIIRFSMCACCRTEVNWVETDHCDPDMVAYLTFRFSGGVPRRPLQPIVRWQVVAEGSGGTDTSLPSCHAVLPPNLYQPPVHRIRDDESDHQAQRGDTPKCRSARVRWEPNDARRHKSRDQAHSHHHRHH
jgi:hypothetical protein